MNRRHFLAGGVGLAATMLSGCSFPRGDSAPEYPAGSLVIHSSHRSDVEITVTTVDPAPEASIETILPAGEALIRRAFVTAESGEAVTLAASVDGGDRLTFEFLPAGTGGATPEYARLDIETPASASWSARAAGDRN